MKQPWGNPLNIKRYAPFLPGLPTPEQDWDQGKKILVCFNEDWAELLVGALEPLRWADLWDDSEGKASDYSRSVQNLMDALSNTGCECDDLCTCFSACVVSSEEVQFALEAIGQENGSLAPSGGSGTQQIAPSERTRDLLPATYQCSNDHAFATARAVVEGIDDAVIEVLQALELVSNTFEAAAIASDAVPIVGIVPAAGSRMADFMINTLTEVYEAAWSDQVRDIIACELFCKIIESPPDCSLSFDQIFFTYADIFPNLPPDDADFTAWVDWLLGLTLDVNEAIVKAGGLVGLIAMKFGSKFSSFVLGHRSIELLIALASDETSDDWEILCSPCSSQWKMRADLTLSQLPAFFSTPIGEWQAGTGIVPDCIVDGQSTNMARLIVTPGSAWKSTRMSISYEGMQIGTNAKVYDLQLAWAVNKLGQGVVVTSTMNFGQVFPGDRKVTHIGAYDIANEVYFQLRSDYRGCEGTFTIVSFEVWGTGVNPFLGEYGWTEVS